MLPRPSVILSLKLNHCSVPNARALRQTCIQETMQDGGSICVNWSELGMAGHITSTNQ